MTPRGVVAGLCDCGVKACVVQDDHDSQQTSLRMRLKQDLRIRKRENLRVCRFASVFECWFGGYGMLLSELRYPELQRWGRLRLNAQTGNGRAICPDDSGARGPTAAALCHL